MPKVGVAYLKIKSKWRSFVCANDNKSDETNNAFKQKQPAMFDDVMFEKVAAFLPTAEIRIQGPVQSCGLQQR